MLSSLTSAGWGPGAPGRDGGPDPHQSRGAAEPITCRPKLRCGLVAHLETLEHHAQVIRPSLSESVKQLDLTKAASRHIRTTFDCVVIKTENLCGPGTVPKNRS